MQSSGGVHLLLSYTCTSVSTSHVRFISDFQAPKALAVLRYHLGYKSLAFFSFSDGVHLHQSYRLYHAGPMLELMYTMLSWPPSVPFFISLLLCHTPCYYNVSLFFPSSEITHLHHFFTPLSWQSSSATALTYLLCQTPFISPSS